MTSTRPILVVDDDIDHAVILRTVLASVAPEAPVEMCTDPSRLPGVLLEAPEGAVVLIDRLLRGVESFPHLKVARDERPDLYVVLLSSALSPEDRARALQSGARDAAEKPGSLSLWRSMLGKMLTDADERDARRGDARAG